MGIYHPDMYMIGGARRRLSSSPTARDVYPWWTEMEAVLAATKILDNPEYAETLKQHNRSQLRREILQLQESLIPFVAKGLSVLEGLNTTRPTSAVLKLDCHDPNYSPMLSGNTRSKPAKVIQSFHFTAEAHILALKLLMFDSNSTDKFLLTEGDVTHVNKVPKPMMYEKIRDLIPQKYRDRIIYFPIVSNYNSWDALWDSKVSFDDENADRQKLWLYLKGLPDYDDSTIITYGDCDELPSEHLLYHLKHCELKPTATLPFASSAPFLMQDFRFIFQNDHPSLGTYCFRFPTIWTLGDLRKKATYWSYPRFRAGTDTQAPFPLVPGGFHLTSAPFVPYLLNKGLSIAEGGLHFLKFDIFKNPFEFYETDEGRAI